MSGRPTVTNLLVGDLHRVGLAVCSGCLELFYRIGIGSMRRRSRGSPP